MNAFPLVSRTPVAVSHLVGFFCFSTLKFVLLIILLLSNDADDPESIRPRYVVYFFEPLSFGNAIKISELGVSFFFSFPLPFLMIQLYS
jgi:hypothetical protein